MVLELARPRPIWQIMFSTHHTDVGLMYLTFSLLAMFVGGAMAIALRIELFAPGVQLIEAVSYTHLTLPTICSV